MTASDALVLPGSPVPLRRLRADEAPYPGVLCAGEPSVICVDDDDLPPVVWRVATVGHLLAPLDAVRTADGVAALLPGCRGRLRGDDASTPGRAVTVAVSIVRAVREAGPLGEEAGSWWVDAGGRPVLALGAGAGWREEAVEILSDLADSASGSLSRVAAEIALGVADSAAVRRHADEWEDALFAAAEPEPLGDLPVGEHPALDTAPRRAATVRREVSTPPADSMLATAIARLVDADIARRTADAISGAWTGTIAALRRMRPRRESGESEGRRRRRGPLLAAVVVIGIVITLGALWPDVDSPSEEASPAPRASGSPATRTAPEKSTPARPSGEELSAVERGAREALALLAQCVAGDPEACAAVREDPGQPLPDGLVASGNPPTDIAILDEYGGVAVVRADAAGFASQAVVLVETDERWLVRDVYDLADQP